MPKIADTCAVRRVVTGHDATGRSVIIQDGSSPFVLRTTATGPVVTDLWKTFHSPADNTGNAEPCSDISLAPPPGGSVFRVVQFPPDAGYMDGWDEHAAFAAMGHDLAGAATRKGKTVGMHTTASVDYAIVLNGEIWAVMDEGETLLKAGDVLVQRGTSHGWSNRTAEPTTVAFVLLDAQPLPARS